MSEQIITRPQNDAYRAGWERIWGGPQIPLHRTCMWSFHDTHCPKCRGPLDENGKCPAEEKVERRAAAIRSM